jgi:hypothetical protein
MKLPLKPTLLMLWIARAFAVFALGLGLTKLVIYSGEPDRVVISESSVQLTAHIATTGSQTITYFHNGPTIGLYAHVVLFACLACGLFALNRRLARLAVVAVSCTLLAMSVFGLSDLIYQLVISNYVATAFWHFKFPAILINSACSTAFMALNIWLAARPPIANKPHDGDGPAFLGQTQLI